MSDENKDDDYLGTTYISHGDQTEPSEGTAQQPDNPAEAPVQAADDFLAGTAEAEESSQLVSVDKVWLESLEQRVLSLEAELYEFKEKAEKRLEVVEKKAGRPPVSPGERFLEIAEDS